MMTPCNKTSFALLVAGLLVSAQLYANAGKTFSIKTNTGQSFQVYANGPEDAGRAIVLIHGWWGLNDQVRSWTDKFAGLGYRAMAVDLYNGKVATSPDKARAYMNSVKQSEVNLKYAAAIAALQKPARKLAILGWSFGATQSLQASLVYPEKISATVMYYPFGKILTPNTNVASLAGPILVIRAKTDSASNIEETTRFITSVKEAEKSITEVTFDARHGFTNPSVEHYDAQATESAWQKTTEFLDSRLGQQQ